MWRVVARIVRWLRAAVWWVVARIGRWLAGAGRWVARRPVIWIPLAVVVAAGLLTLLLGPLAWWATPAKHLQGKDKAEVRNATRQTLLAAVGGLVLLTGAAFTARTFFLSRRGQLTDRYTKAISQLASDQLTERLGGIYALEHLIVESERDHDTVVDVLAAFIRERAPMRPSGTTPLGPVGTEHLAQSRPGTPAEPPTDVQAALTVLGRRPIGRSERNPIGLAGANLRGTNLFEARLRNANLSGALLQGATLDKADLRNANLSGAQLQGATFENTQLEAAILQEAQLQRAYLVNAQLQAADFYEAQLQGANFGGADLQNVDFSGAQLQRASLFHTNLRDALLDNTNLEGADLRRARGLTLDQILMANIDVNTGLPVELYEALAADRARDPEAEPGTPT